jgi:hypothetical protein
VLLLGVTERERSAVMGKKDKGGREAKKPKKDKK